MSKGKYQLDRYHPLEFKTRSDLNSSRGGVGIYVKDTLSYEVREDLSVFIPHVFEAVFIEIKIKNKHIIIGTVLISAKYTPKKLMLTYSRTLCKDCKSIIHRENKEVFIMGDINIDLLQYSNHYKTNDYTEGRRYYRKVTYL